MGQNQGYDRLIQKIAKNIKETRLDKGITQEDMVDYGFNYRHYQKIESGKHSINLYTLYRLSRAFKVDLEKLLT